MGLAFPQAGFGPALDLLGAQPSIQRMGIAIEAMRHSAVSIPKLKRRHTADYAAATSQAQMLGTMLGVLDDVGYLDT